MIRNTFLLLSLFGTILLGQTNIEFVGSLNQYPSVGYSDIWGYVDLKGNEYALMGVGGGTSIISLIDPTNPTEVAFIPGPFAPPFEWRDIKTHLNYAYVVTEGTGSGQGLQIIDLSDLPNSATLVNTVDTWFSRAHNIFIDNGYAYVTGTSGGGGMRILDLSNPVNPVQTANYTASGSIHDAYVWDDTVVVCAELLGEYHLVDVTNKSDPQLVSASPFISGIYAHSGWMTEDKRYFIAAEEFDVRDLIVYDLQDRSTWEVVVPSWQMSGNSPIHNIFVLGNYAHISYYKEGYIILDISDPTNPTFVGQYDTHPGTGDTYDGAWGVYPYLPSGVTIVSDIETGLYVFQFRLGYLPPTIIHAPMNAVFNTDPITISAEIIDSGQVVDANIHYRTTFDGSTSDWFLVNDSNGPANNTYEFEIPGQQHLTAVEYYIAAVDDSNDVSTLPMGGSSINPLGGTPPPEFLSFEVILAGIPDITSFFPSGDTTIQKNDEIDFTVEAIDTSGLELSYKWFKNDRQVAGINNTFHYRHSSFDPPPHTDVIKVVVSNGYLSTEKSWSIFVEPITDVEDENNPGSYSLKQNYPNPFNPSTQIRYSIANSEFVNLSIFNSLGEKVAELVNESKPAGNYTVTFDAGNFSSGVYIARITAGLFIQIIKMSLLK